MDEFWFDYTAFIGYKVYNDENALYRIKKNAKSDLNAILDNITKSDIVFLGDSVLTYAASDEEKTSIPKLFSLLSKGNIYNFSAGSFSFFLYSYLFKKFNKKFKKAFKGKIVIFEINLRSFSDEWYIRPTYRFEHIDSLFNKKPYDVAIQIYSNKLNEQTENFYNLPLTTDITKYKEFNSCTTIRDVFNYFKQNPSIYSHQFDFYYGYSLARLKNRLTPLESVLDFFHSIKTDSKLFCWLTPLNNKYFSQELDKSIRDKTSYLSDFIKKKGLTCLDFTYSITESNKFLDKEHLNINGRRELAKLLSANISKSIYPTLNSSIKHYGGGCLRQIEPFQFRLYSKLYEEFLKINCRK